MSKNAKAFLDAIRRAWLRAHEAGDTDREFVPIVRHLLGELDVKRAARKTKQKKAPTPPAAEAK